jgi:hypothetical protein
MSTEALAAAEQARAQAEKFRGQATMLQGQTIAASEQLQDVKGAATTWGTTLTGLLGLGGILALFQGETGLVDLSPEAQLWAAGLLLAALVLAVFAIYQALIAAHLNKPDPDKALAG